MAALKARHLERHQIRMPRRELRRPHLVVGAARVRVLPHVLDIERMLDGPALDILGEQPLHKVLVERQRALRENRVAELLEFFQDLVIQARIVVIDASQHHDADAVFAFQLIQNLARPLADAGFVIVERRVAALDGPLVFFLRQAQHRFPRREHLLGEKLAVLQVDHRVKVRDPVVLEDVRFLGIGGFHRFRSRRHCRAGIGCHDS